MPQNIVAPYTMKEINARLDESERELTEAFLAQSRKSMSEVITRNV